MCFLILPIPLNFKMMSKTMINLRLLSQDRLLPAILMLLMAMTRMQHFGGQFTLPDASLAVFFAAGLWLTRSIWFWVFCIWAALIDGFAIQQMGVSDFCVTSAYVFLLPTYALVWAGGRLGQPYFNLEINKVLGLLALAGLVISGAFLISNGSFYVLSGQFAGHWADYLDNVVRYYPSYVFYSLAYVVFVIVIGLVFRAVTEHLPVEAAQDH